MQHEHHNPAMPHNGHNTHTGKSEQHAAHDHGAMYSKMIQNLWWATGYNVFAIPLAAGVLYPKFLLSPALGAVLMSVSTVIVALNAQLLHRFLKNCPKISNPDPKNLLYLCSRFLWSSVLAYYFRCFCASSPCRRG